MSPLVQACGSDGSALQTDRGQRTRGLSRCRQRLQPSGRWTIQAARKPTHHPGRHRKIPAEMQQAQQPSLRHPTATPVATESAREDRTEFVLPSFWRFVSISVGLNYTRGVRTDDSVACWGSDSSGRATLPSGEFAWVSDGPGGPRPLEPAPVGGPDGGVGGG